MTRDTADPSGDPRWARRLLDGLSDGFCVIELIVDETDRVIDARFCDTNPAFARLTGVEGAEGRLASDAFPGLERAWLQHYESVWRSGEPAHFVDRAESLGSTWYEVTLARMGNGAERRLTCLFKDVTERRRVEEEHERVSRHLHELATSLSESDRRKTEFLATLAHELRNPLAPLWSGLELIGEHAGDAAEVTRLRDMLARQVGQMTHLVDDLLDVSRISQGTIELKLERSVLGDVIGAAVDSVRPLVKVANHALELDLPDARIELVIDPVRVTQIVANLLNNAVRYTPRGGHLRLSVTVEEAETVIAVSDDGEGIDADGLERIFEMFTQLRSGAPDRQGGLGIGLTLSRRLVELHGGTLGAASDGPGLGSRFEVRLPLHAALLDTALPDLRNRSAGGATPDTRRILVVDDNEDAAVALARLLQLRGFEPRVVYRGQAAIEAVTGGDIDVVLLDIGLPDLSGYAVAREILAWAGEERRPTLVALTGWGTEQDVRRSEEAGFDHHLTKPVSAKRLLELLERIARARA